ncbi:MAG: hypothetical protein K0R65_916 [Crocinitomicaceae bacterium]|jgi:hypothetical protein|nr:hypothetical protein [Crocinitomicaceae bacterium]
MKKNHVFLFVLVSLVGLAFTKMSPSQSVSSYTGKAGTKSGDPVCDTISFNAQIAPVFYKNCAGCHEGISEFKSVSEYSDHILKTLTGNGAPQMPKDADPLPDSIIRQFTCWIEQGKLNN